MQNQDSKVERHLSLTGLSHDQPRNPQRKKGWGQKAFVASKNSTAGTSEHYSAVSCAWGATNQPSDCTRTRMKSISQPLLLSSVYTLISGNFFKSNPREIILIQFSRVRIIICHAPHGVLVPKRPDLSNWNFNRLRFVSWCMLIW